MLGRECNSTGLCIHFYKTSSECNIADIIACCREHTNFISISRDCNDKAHDLYAGKQNKRVWLTI
jgi:hypothetical protein